jgi:nucleoside-diphosphate kinase
MTIQTTLNIVKPNAVRKRAVGHVIRTFEANGLEVVALRMETLSREKAERFYAEHHGKPFFAGLIAFMTSGPVVAMALRGEDAIARVREIMGNTNPDQAAPGTLRAELADSMTENAVHGSDSPGSAAREVAFFFPGLNEHLSPGK